MSTSTKEVVGFSFQEIPLDEARNAVLAGDGNYSDIKQTLLEKLPDLAPDKAFAFGLPNGKEVPEESRRGICMAVNATLKRAGLAWRITYSSAKKIFICLPLTTKNKPEHSLKKYEGDRSEDQKILALRAQGFSSPEIAKQVSAPKARVDYLCYVVAAKIKKAKKQDIVQSNGKVVATTPTQLVETARILFNYKGDFDDRQGKAIRKAISSVGINTLHLDFKTLAPLIGLTPKGVYYNAHDATGNFGKKEIKTLENAVN